ncbi:RNA polymerase sigma factor region1.1 domain-containing protein [Methylobacterium nodulans]|uniref:RNA polymerase sigma factor 70 region 1.1 domain-containing protein n=1 Tax=Methylobacterium nodulans (strain LMG 21967 / CNCM I-2342 / ORS 2060) TaxID=460265 RepID=B8IG36_METNO|nr:RNA polymerase sigma factor region1.1 domain-containing protein [Methylobacterium nodulans]ACL61513.1 conserved hypothetical protein [Methylobacterium nodulans ORS 2060]
MPPAFDRATLDRLIARGRAQGQLTTADLRRELPIDGMSPDTIALVLIELEEAGIPVELEESLLAPGRAAPSALPPAELPQRNRAAAEPPAAAPPAAAAAARPAPPAAPGSPPWATGAHRAVMLAGLAALILALLVVAVVTH